MQNISLVTLIQTDTKARTFSNTFIISSSIIDQNMIDFLSKTEKEREREREVERERSNNKVFLVAHF